MAKYIKGKDGKFKGSIGDGKTRVPTAAQTPAGLRGSLESVQQVTYGRAPIAFPQVTLSYDPNEQISRLDFALGKGGSFKERRERKKVRQELEELFGPIGWDVTETPAGFWDGFEPAAPVEPVAPVATQPAPVAPVPPRPKGTDKYQLEATSGRTGTLWLRGTDGNFFRAGENVRMLFEKPGSYAVKKDSEWYTKEHILIQYGSYARRYDIDDVSFTPTDMR